MDILKLQPVFKDYIWGGTRLKDEYGYKTDLNPVAEGWVLANHRDGKNTIIGGEFDGQTLDDLTLEFGKDLFLGTKSLDYDYFPLLIKLIDAKDKLSIQVHPNDEYARRVENEYGKTEMWYVLDATDDAELIYGFKEKITKDQFKQAIENNTLTDVLNSVKVKKGDIFFIESGTVHAIGAGILLAEIQQNSNCTYRVYDYGRLQNNKPRELHIQKALDVANTDKINLNTNPDGDTEKHTFYSKLLLKRCPLFTVYRYDIHGLVNLTASEDSFQHILILDGEGTIGSYKFKKGDSFFIPANLGDYQINGEASLMLTEM